MHRTFLSFSWFGVYHNKSSYRGWFVLCILIAPLGVILQDVMLCCTRADIVEIAVSGQSVKKLFSRRLKQLKKSICWSIQHFSVFMWHKIRIPTETLFYENPRFLLEILKTLKRCSSLIFHRRKSYRPFWNPCDLLFK